MPKEIKAWDSLRRDEKKLFARQMEVFAGFAEHTDDEVGRLVDALEEMGELDNTLFFYIIGDNGAERRGRTLTARSTRSISAQRHRQRPWPRSSSGSTSSAVRMTFNHFAVGWALAGNTPFQWVKQMASHFGGTRNPLIVHWPKGIKAKGEVRSQFHHVIDIARRSLEAASVPQPDVVNGVKQRPIEGVTHLVLL